MVFVLDNYDSFTYNLVQYMGELGAEILVRPARHPPHPQRGRSTRLTPQKTRHPERSAPRGVEGLS